MKNSVITFKNLRLLVGILGGLLPVLLVLVSFLDHNCSSIQGSISDYHNTVSRNVFVGVVCLFSAFLFAYKGYDILDNTLCKLASMCGVTLTMFPTTNKLTECSIISSFSHPEWFQTVHLISAGIFFILMAWMSFFQFTKSSNFKTYKKTVRNKIYRACSVSILGSVILIIVYYILPETTREIISVARPVFLLETLALWSFSFSWLVKGGFILKDDGLYVA